MNDHKEIILEALKRYRMFVGADYASLIISNNDDAIVDELESMWEYDRDKINAAIEWVESQQADALIEELERTKPNDQEAP